MQAVAETLHLIEPTLAEEVGHCHALVLALAQAAPAGCDLQVWAARSFGSAWSGPGRLHAHFSRRWRRLQAYALYRRLLREPGRLLITTAGTTDLLLAACAAPGRIEPGKCHAFVHWLNTRESKRRLLERLARRQPHLQILAPTDSVARFFVDCGFDAAAVPYPLAVDTHAAAPQASGFRHLLVAGGARLDKGFDCIVELAELMVQRGLDWPLTVQISREQRHHDDDALTRWIERLRACALPHLTLREDTLTPSGYRQLFPGAVVLQPYRPDLFTDRVSGVTLDALGAGAPVIASAQTWMARLVQRFDAGVVLSERTPHALAAAIERVLAAHAAYAQRALQASAHVRAEHSAAPLMAQVLGRAGHCGTPGRS